jgi:hypothetical protein
MASPHAAETIAIKGLRQPVEILIDRWGVPHIYAKNEPDLVGRGNRRTTRAPARATAQATNSNTEISFRSMRASVAPLSNGDHKRKLSEASVPSHALSNMTSCKEPAAKERTL